LLPPFSYKGAATEIEFIMIKRKFGWTDGNVPVIGQGTWYIDSAEMHGNGRVEEMVAEAIAGRRDKVFLPSKVLPSNASFEGTLRACERSLRGCMYSRTGLRAQSPHGRNYEIQH